MALPALHLLDARRARALDLRTVSIDTNGEDAGEDANTLFSNELNTSNMYNKQVLFERVRYTSDESFSVDPNTAYNDYMTMLDDPYDERLVVCMGTQIYTEYILRALFSSFFTVYCKYTRQQSPGTGIAEVALVSGDGELICYWNGFIENYALVEGTRLDFGYAINRPLPLQRFTGTFNPENRGRGSKISPINQGVHVKYSAVAKGSFFNNRLMEGSMYFKNGSTLSGNFSSIKVYLSKWGYTLVDVLNQGTYSSHKGVAFSSLGGLYPMYVTDRRVDGPMGNEKLPQLSILSGTGVLDNGPRYIGRLWKVDKRKSRLYKKLDEFMKLSDPELGGGQDRVEHETFESLQLVDVYNIEYKESLRNTYAALRDSILMEQCPNWYTKESVATDHLFDGLLVHGGLNRKYNEKMLFHGTSRNAIDSIIANVGFDKNIARTGIFGPGWYFAEKPGKSDEYTATMTMDDALMPHPNCVNLLSPERTTDDDVRYMLIVKVSLGCPARVTKSSYKAGETKWKVPFLKQNVPRLRDFDDLLTPYSSVVFDQVPKEGRYREYIVYNEMQAIPAFLVAYRRQ